MRRLYRHISIGSEKWAIVYAPSSDPALAPASSDSDPCYGATEYATRTIIINEDAPKQSRPNTILHEIGHATWDHAGIGHTCRISGHREEQVLHPLASLMIQALISGGFWKMPKAEE
jgi:hypothetical protein